MAQEELKHSSADGRAVKPTRFADDGHWVRLATGHGVRLPRATTAVTHGAMERWLRRLGVSRAQYLMWTGESSLRDFARANPTWHLRAWVGLLLEWVDERDRLSSCATDPATVEKRSEGWITADVKVG